MKVWSYVGFDGFYPVGTSAVIVANTAEQAVELLNNELVGMLLPPSATLEKVKQIKTTTPIVVILNDGNY